MKGSAIARIATLFTLASCAIILALLPMICSDGCGTSVTPDERAATWRSARNWAYQLQNLSVRELRKLNHDILVIDYARDGRKQTQFTRSEVNAIRSKPNGTKRIVLAYMSIGEAESYRYYWNAGWQLNPPSWMGAENERWRKNFPVKFWEKSWQDIIFGSPGAYLEKLIAAGFDGVYLDRIDVYQQLTNSHPAARQAMIDFVVNLAADARKKRSDFLVIAQNAEELLEDSRYLKAIDGIAVEDLTFGAATEGARNPPDDIEYAKQMLSLAKNGGKTVMVVEYIENPLEVISVAKDYASRGFLAYFGPRSLDRIRAEPAQPPS